MIKKLLSLSIMLCVIPFFSMQAMQDSCIFGGINIQLRDGRCKYSFGVTKNATIGELKSTVSAIYQIPVDDQSISAVSNLLFMKKISEPLDNNARINDIIWQHNTKDFLLLATLSSIRIDK